ncbi:DUF4143 domain-containing protein, partial [Facilibium subflavum]|uniref:DUF4143 domain-containing protein n=1 Tax=Facilibium subflavum TaxID=2219058 RepID=UPI000E65CEFF
GVINVCLRAINDYYFLGYEIFYWRTRNKIEVDFVLYGNNGLYAFEVKNKQKLQPKDFKGLKLFLSDYPVARCYMVYGGARRYYEGDVEVIPVQEALVNLEAILKH